MEGTSESELSGVNKILADISTSGSKIPSPRERKIGNTRLQEVLEAGPDFTAVKQATATVVVIPLNIFFAPAAV